MITQAKKELRKRKSLGANGMVKYLAINFPSIDPNSLNTFIKDITNE